MKQDPRRPKGQGVQNSDARLENLSRYLFTAPHWPVPLALFAILAGCVDLGLLTTGSSPFPTVTLLFTLPVICGFIATKPIVSRLGRPMTWNRSSLLAASAGLFGLLITGTGLVLYGGRFPLWYGIALAFIFGLRLLVLVAISDARSTRMSLPALMETVPGIIAGGFLIPGPFVLLAVIFHLIFWAGFTVFFWLIDEPMYRSLRIPGLSLLNAYVAHHTDGSKSLEVFFRKMGEEVYVPQATIFIRRTGRGEILFTVPNIHPGPMGTVGGSNLPSYLHDAFSGNVLVPHGCATHDFNLVSIDEAEKLVHAVNGTRDGLKFHPCATHSFRVSEGTVSLLVQRFSDTLLIVGTRFPLKTEDLEFAMSLAIIGEGRQFNSHIAFVDAHNCMTAGLTPVLAGSKTAAEYLGACRTAGKMSRQMEELPFSAGYSRMALPYSEDEGYGQLGVQVMVIGVAGRLTAYVLYDGNNMVEGMRDEIRNALLALVDEAEVMTTDTHVVNMLSGKNPVGCQGNTRELIEYTLNAVRDAILDMAPSESAGSTATCDRVVIFGSSRIAQLASTVGTILVYVPPLILGMLLLAGILSLLVYVALYPSC